MPDVNYEGDTVEIDSETVAFSERIENTLVVDDTVLVQFEPGEMDPRNLVAYDTQANRLWRVSPLRESPSEHPRPVGRVAEGDEYVHLDTRPVGKCYELDLETGDVEYVGWRR